MWAESDPKLLELRVLLDPILHLKLLRVMFH